ncbi:MAG: DUF559 domain-containing protein [Armatimonadota bacterium]
MNSLRYGFFRNFLRLPERAQEGGSGSNLYLCLCPNPENIERVRGLRNEATKGEKILWSRIRADKIGFRFRRQHPVLEYALDFYCPEAKLCIEIDGELYDAERDERRDARLTELGVETIRISSFAMFDEDRLSSFIEKIYESCRERSERDPLSVGL